MALRVLLADESATIKKVFQLALQDYGLELQPVHMGIDVMDLTEKFRPDIIFVDILLQKKNGYEVSAELKSSAMHSQIPTVLMWSGFMELDKDKYEASRADGQLEKPFDVETLRALIQKLVPQTKDQPLASFLDFPEAPEEMNQSTSNTPPIQPDSAKIKGEDESWNMSHFEDVDLPTVETEEDEFQERSFSNRHELPLETDQDQSIELDESEDEMNNWSSQPLSKFRMSQPELGEDEDLPVTFEDPSISEEISIESVAVDHEMTSSDDDDAFDSFSPEPDFGNTMKRQDLEVEHTTRPARDEHDLLDDEPELSSSVGLSKSEIEVIVRDEARKALEKVIWQVVPPLAEQLLKRQIQELIQSPEIEG